MRNLIHPDDLWEYEEELPKRVQGIDLGRELCVRMKGITGEYHLFSFHTEIVADEKNSEKYLLILIHNENVLPRIDAMTDLYSQARFTADLEAEIGKKQPFAVLMIKLERFTNLNIIYGNDITNQILKETALQETVGLLEILPEFVLNVNVSARQIEREEFRAEVLRMLDETKFPASHLCLELTEQCKDMPLEVIKREVEFFQGYGIRMAMDDYRTGSASSGIVLHAPMDEIKLDMSFIRGNYRRCQKAGYGQVNRRICQ